MIQMVISGTGSYLPEKELTNVELESMIDTDHDWIVSRTGIHSRRIASAHESTAFMAAAAAQKALDAANLDKEEIDLILVATCTADRLFPGAACTVQNVLQIKRTVPALDVNAACSGFIYAIDVAKQYIAAGTARHVLVIGSERMSQTLDWTDRSTCILFGDGAGAVILSASDRPGVLGSVLHASYDDKNLLTLANTAFSTDLSSIDMHGNEVFKLAVNVMSDLVDEVLALSHLKQSDVQWLIPHQANIRIIRAIAKKLDLPMSQVIVTVGEHGNTSAASIPLALDYAIKNNQIQRDDVLLIESFGGGMTWGAMVIRY